MPPQQTRANEMRDVIERFDWEASGLGPRATWPRELETVLRLALDTPFPMTVMWGPDLRQIYNDAMIPIFGDKHPVALGKPACESWVETWDQVGPLLDGVRECGEPVYFENLPLIVRRNGEEEEAYFTFSYSPIRVGPSVAGVICVLNETTEHVMRERAKDEKASALAAIDEAKNVFFENVSHEFRTPLTLMLGPLEQLARELPTYEQRQLAEVARRNAVRLRKHVNLLLDYALVRSGVADLHVETLDIGELTAGLASEFRSAFEGAGLTLEVAIASGPPLAVDRSMYEKIVLNLLSNALKYTFVGGVTVMTGWTADGFELSIRDTGVGVADSDRDRIFQRFERVRGSRVRTDDGSGIGLALTRELVRLHGGDIAVASAPDEGTTFTVRLPHRSDVPPLPVRSDTRELRRDFVDEVPSATSDVPHAERFASSGTAHVLVADDNVDLLRYIASLLAPHYRVTTARDGTELLDRARTDRPDLIVTDVLMPGIDGFEALSRVRIDPVLANVPVILLSARGSSDATTRGLLAGADDYIVKPFVAADLLARIGALLRRSAAIDASRYEFDALQAAELLATASDRFLSAADVDAVWDAVTSTLTPGFADWCAINIPDRDGTLRTVSLRHREAAKARLGEQLSREYPNRLGDGTPATAVFEMARSAFFEHVDAEVLQRSARDEKHLAILKALSLRSAIVTPIAVRGAVVASLTVVRSENLVNFTRHDVDVVERIAARVAIAYESSTAHQRARTIALTLQQALLPAALPTVPGLLLSASYSPASQESLVGGDWYDAFALDNGSVVISIGDVVGHGLHAATVMASLRLAVRGLAADRRDPASILQALNRLLLVDHPGALATALIAIVDGQGLDGVTASAGHYGAIRISEAGHVGTVGGGGLMLGVDADATYESTPFTFEPGDLLAFFTDGYVENERDVFEGERDLVDALVRARTSSEPASIVHLELFGTEAPRDDAALLTAYAQRDLPMVTLRLAAVPPSAARFRRAIARFLESTPLSAAHRFEVLTAVGEAVINAIEHAYAQAPGDIFVSCKNRGGVVTIDIRDEGSWLDDRRSDDQRGYGLPLMHALTDGVAIERRPSGTSVQMTVRLPSTESAGQAHAHA